MACFASVAANSQKTQKTQVAPVNNMNANKTYPLKQEPHPSQQPCPSTQAMYPSTQAIYPSIQSMYPLQQVFLQQQSDPQSVFYSHRLIRIIMALMRSRHHHLELYCGPVYCSTGISFMLTYPAHVGVN
eukprot:m.57443 g.57443  ORF g.57443 m.57443 type:complete len:129 (-) comp13084_c0_seq4:401-787(-)